MPRAAVSPVVILGIAGQQPMHDPPNCVNPPLDQQMNVIGHQTESIEIKRQPLFQAPKEREKFRMILVRMKDHAPLIAARNYMIKPALISSLGLLGIQWSNYAKHNIHEP